MDVLLRRFLRAGIRRGAGRELVLVPPRRRHVHVAPGPERQGEAPSPPSRSRPGEQVLITVRDRGGAPDGRSRRCRRLTPVPGPLAAGERVLLIDPKDRRYLLTLVPGATFHTHAGVLAHDDIIGETEGCTVTGSTGRSFLALRPTLSDVVLKMPRGAQVIYPKDLGAILIAADIGPGQRVLEAGRGLGRACR